MLSTFIAAFMAFFAIMNPIANLPVFLALVVGDDVRTRNRVAGKALLLAFGIITVFALAGKLIFEVFGITLPALRIAGGLVLFVIGYYMLNGKKSPIHHPAKAGDGDEGESQALSVAVSPLAMPLLAGPGTIATAMNLAAANGMWGSILTIAAFATLCVICYICFRYGATIVKVLGTSAMDVITRLMGLILAVIAVQMIIAGLQSAFPVLHG